MSAFCNNCGTPQAPGARFCSTCGTVIAGAPPAAYPPFAPRLVRPFHGRQFAGVCIGLARTYGWDTGLVRILTVIGGIFLFPFVEIIYIACWIGIPEEPLAELPPPPPPM